LLIIFRLLHEYFFSCATLTRDDCGLFDQVRRVLVPGGKAIISQSNRCFPSKAISMWLNMNDREHLELINGYAKYAGFGPGKAYDITASVPDEQFNNPMFIIEVSK